jgi:hypothetical protein
MVPYRALLLIRGVSVRDIWKPHSREEGMAQRSRPKETGEQCLDLKREESRNSFEVEALRRQGNAGAVEKVVEDSAGGPAVSTGTLERSKKCDEFPNLDADISLKVHTLVRAFDVLGGGLKVRNVTSLRGTRDARHKEQQKHSHSITH